MIVSWAQNGEDIVLRRALHDIERGFYLDVGAADPDKDSVTKLFYENGWSGINIEPALQYFTKLVKSRSRDLNLQVAVGAAEGMLDLHMFEDCGLSTLVADIAQVHRKAGFVSTMCTTPVRQLQNILNEHNIVDVHFLKIDVEGFEEQVLQGLDLKKTRPWIIVYECTTPNTNIVSDGQIPEILAGENYTFAFFDGINKFFVAEEHRSRLSFLYPANVIDNFLKFEHYETIKSLQKALAEQHSHFIEIDNHQRLHDEASEDYIGDLQRQLSLKQHALEEAIASSEALQNAMIEQNSHFVEIDNHRRMHDETSESYVGDLQQQLSLKQNALEEAIAFSRSLQETLDEQRNQNILATSYAETLREEIHKIKQLYEHASQYALDLRDHLDKKSNLLDEDSYYAESLLRSLRLTSMNAPVSSKSSDARCSNMAFTICSINYLAYAKTLQNSFRDYHDIRLIIFVADKTQLSIEEIGIDDLIFVDEKIAPNFETMAAIYTIMEYNTAVKPHCIEYLMDTYDADNVIYLDPDIFVTSSLKIIFDVLEAGIDCVLTPHITSPLDDGRYPDDLAISRAGIYNLGFLGISNRPESRRFVRWWRRWLENDCVVDLKRGIFVDQRFCDFAPSFIDRTFILRDPGFNLAYWNLLHRYVATVDGVLQTNGIPVKFIHFSGVDKSNPDQFSKHQNRYTRENLGALLPVFDSYVECLFKNDKFSRGLFSETPYGFGHLDSGLKVSDILRTCIRRNRQFIPSGTSAYALQKDFFLAPDEFDNPNSIGRLLAVIYSSRPDLRESFDVRTHSGRNALDLWAVNSLLREYGIDPSWATSFEVMAIAGTEPSSGDATERNAAFQSLGDPLEVEAAVAFTERLTGKHLDISDVLKTCIWRNRQFISAGAGTYELHKDFFLAPSEPNNSDSVGRLLATIYASRPDLQNAFDLKTRSGREAFGHWAGNHLFREYGVDPSWATTCGAAPTGGRASPADDAVEQREPTSHENWEEVAEASSSSKQSTDNEVTMLRERSSPRRLVPKLGNLFRRGVSAPASDKPPVTGASHDNAERHRGLAIYGFLKAETGLGEAGRALAGAFATTGLPISLHSINPPYFENEINFTTSDIMTNTLNTALLAINADNVINIAQYMDPSLLNHNRRVGLFFWELPVFPGVWARSEDTLDEIWVSTRFVCSSLSSAIKKPIRIVPLPVEMNNRDQYFSRSQLGLPEERVIFLSTFDYNSFPQRKNPAGAINAFLHAFPNDTPSGPLLVIKCHGVANRGVWESDIKTLASSHGHVKIIDEVFSTEKMRTLQAACDVFVSLHRAEGFGLNLAECMAAGKLTIATDFSGNTDFMTPDNSLLITYSMRRVGEDEYPYSSGQWWAEPSIDDAVESMRSAMTHALRARLGARAKSDIANQLSPNTVGSIMNALIK